MDKEYYAYLRVSTVKQTEGASLQAQKDAIERYARTHDLTISKWYEEKETAAKQGRPLFTQMVKSLQSGAAHGVIMHKIDRSARNFRDWATIGELHDAGIDIRFANENVDFATRGGRLSADIQAVFAADYIRNLKEEIAKGQNARLAEGLYPWSAPMGYLNTGKGKPKAIDPVTGPYVALMFELYATGQYSIASLQQELQERGVRSKNGKTVYIGKIEEILANPFYSGVIRIKRTGRSYPGIHKPLISPAQFRQVQRVKENRSRRKKTKHDHLLRGMFQCGQCGNSMIPERQRGHVYYRCHTRACPPNCVRSEVLEQIIKDKFSQLQINSDQQAAFQQALAAWLRDVSQVPKQDTVAMEEAKIAGAKDRLTDALINGVIDEATFKDKALSLDLRQAELSIARENQQSKQEQAAFAEAFLEHAKTLAVTYFMADPPEKRQMLDLCFSNMSVFGKKPVIQTKNWLVEALDLTTTPFCADYRGENRSCPELGELVIERIADCLSYPEVHDLRRLCDAVIGFVPYGPAPYQN